METLSDNWERIESRSRPGNYFYHNKVTGITTWVRPKELKTKRKETKRKPKVNKNMNMSMDHILSNHPKQKKSSRKRETNNASNDDDASTLYGPINDKLTIGENLLRLAKSSDDNIFQSVLPIKAETYSDETKAKIETVADNRIVISWPEGHTIVQHFKKSNRNKITAVYVGKTKNYIASGHGMFIVFADERNSIVRHESLGYWKQDTMMRGKFERLERVEIGKYDRGKVIGMLYRKGQISERGVFMEGSDFVEPGDATVVEHSVSEAHVAINEANTTVREIHDLFRALRQRVYEVCGFSSVNMETLSQEFREDTNGSSLLSSADNNNGVLKVTTNTKTKEKKSGCAVNSTNETTTSRKRVSTSTPRNSKAVKKRKLPKKKKKTNNGGDAKTKINLKCTIQVRISKRNQEKERRKEKESEEHLENLEKCHEIIRKQRLELGRLKALSVQYLRCGQNMTEQRKEQLRENIYALSRRSEDKKAVSGALNFLQALIQKAKHEDDYEY